MKLPTQLEAVAIPGIGWGVFGLVDDSGEKVPLYEPDDRVGPEVAHLFAASLDLLAACESHGESGGDASDGPALLEMAAEYLEFAGFFDTAISLRRKAEQERAAIAKAKEEANG